jgi:hypothetical protein
MGLAERQDRRRQDLATEDDEIRAPRGDGPVEERGNSVLGRLAEGGIGRLAPGAVLEGEPIDVEPLGLDGQTGPFFARGGRGGLGDHAYAVAGGGQAREQLGIEHGDA